MNAGPLNEASSLVCIGKGPQTVASGKFCVKRYVMLDMVGLKEQFLFSQCIPLGWKALVVTIALPYCSAKSAKVSLVVASYLLLLATNYFKLSYTIAVGTPPKC